MHACLKVGDNLSTIRRQVLVPRFITILQMLKNYEGWRFKASWFEKPL
jgi:hypothetical protein